MNIQQLRFIHAVANNGLSISNAATELHTSQPGISRQIKALEEELGVEIFERGGKQLTRITPVGAKILDRSTHILDEIAAIRSQAKEAKNPEKGVLSIATTHSQARYVLPDMIARFKNAYPEVDINLHQGSSGQMLEMLESGQVDLCIVSEDIDEMDNLVMMPCYQWARGLVVPEGHALHTNPPGSLHDVAKYPLLTFMSGFTGRSALDRAFSQLGLQPRVVFSATDADVIKTYVALGLGVGIISRAAFDEKSDSGLVLLDASELFERGITRIGMRRGFHLRKFHYSFIEIFAPHLKEPIVRQSLASRHAAQRKWLFLDEQLPLY